MTPFSTPPSNYSQSWASTVLSQIQNAFNFCAKTNEGVGRIIMQSPDGKSWAVTVTNTGTLQATVMDGSER